MEMLVQFPENAIKRQNILEVDKTLSISQLDPFVNSSEPLNADLLRSRRFSETVAKLQSNS